MSGPTQPSWPGVVIGPCSESIWGMSLMTKTRSPRRLTGNSIKSASDAGTRQAFHFPSRARKSAKPRAAETRRTCGPRSAARNRAMPFPPSVSISARPWDRPARNRTHAQRATQWPHRNGSREHCQRRGPPQPSDWLPDAPGWTRRNAGKSAQDVQIGDHRQLPRPKPGGAVPDSDPGPSGDQRKRGVGQDRWHVSTAGRSPAR